ncbi:unnamed protein product, partial [marine sediment metagenome]
GTGRHSFWSQLAGSNEFREAEVDTLDNILRELGVKGVDFIKMNIQGAEIEVLKGMEETLGNNVKLAIKVDHIVNTKTTEQIIAPKLKDMGFNTRIRGGTLYGRKRSFRNRFLPYI